MTNTSFHDLADFITNRMRMSHIYQPAMLITQSDRRDAYIVAINDHLHDPKAQIPHQGIYNDPLGQPSLHA